MGLLTLGALWALVQKRQSNFLAILGNCSVVFCLVVFVALQGRDKPTELFIYLLILITIPPGLPIVWIAHVLAGRQIARVLLRLDRFF
ncbi:hypothetical protein OA90_27070 [Labrenzia sp. OB1]|nr:hypothetical protein OA90_27070 [Labrenzia sp. OB1]